LQQTVNGLLIDRGAARATIVVPSKHDPAAAYAANDIREVLHKIAGVALPIVQDSKTVSGNRILVGRTRFTDAVVTAGERRQVGSEGYVVRLKGRDLALAGGGPYGTIYAAAELYDRLGARWYLPGELGECLPELPTVRFSRLDVARRPSFPMRWVGKDNTWNLRNRMNRTSVKGLPPAYVIYPSIYHTQRNLLPAEKYFKSHPEYYARVRGQRRHGPKFKLCNSNPDLPKVLARNMAAALRAKPEIDLISLSPTDGHGWCQCPDCCKLDEPGEMILYKRVAGEQEKDFPDQIILTSAYSVYTQPPKDPTIKAHRNLAVIVCHYSGYCLAHGVADPTCGPNRNYLALVRAWKRHTPHVYFYEYYNKVNWYDLPWPIVHTVAADIPFFHRIGIQGLYTQYSTGNIWTNFMPMYVAARLLWDHTTDVKALLEEFYPRFYGPAAEGMKQYHEALETQMAGKEHHISGAGYPNSLYVFPEPLMEKLDGYLAKAGSQAAGDLVKRRIAKIRVLHEYTRRLTRAFRLYRDGQAAEGARRRTMLEESLAILESLQAEGKKGRPKYEGVVTWRRFYHPKKYITKMVRDLQKWLAAG